ncbi:hypothetical protein [Serratia liquefaciens]|uniref:Uncharacterized protein n=1 Tax=Serratia liquefaciens TaxID=614 RepID=A0A515CTJ4_SERLI|nr:hypothetical protein [Serratia liquefaciens]QDL31489.1 hypothetical protein EGO53_06705 [Serratia liquefaciens]
MKYDLKIGVNVDVSDLDKVEAQLKRILELQKQVNNANKTVINETAFSVKNGMVFINESVIKAQEIPTERQSELLRNLTEEVAKDFLARQLRPGGALWQRN